MLVTTKELLCVANAENKAIGAFNITGLETLQAVLQAAESKKEPVILQFAQVHEEEHIMSLDLIGPIMVMMADQATIPVAVQLDHGVDLHILKKALDMGFTSVMYDGSSLPYGENIAYTRMAVSMAKEYGVCGAPRVLFALFRLHLLRCDQSGEHALFCLNAGRHSFVGLAHARVQGGVA